MNRTKIIATVGPATCEAGQLQALVAAGASVFRLNGSHSDLAWHRAAIQLIRSAVPSVPILLDIPGRKIRTTQLAHEPSFNVGEVIILTTDTTHNGSLKVPVNYPDLHKDIVVGAVVHADDGTLRFTVTRVEDRDIHCRAEAAGTLRSRKGINVPSVKLRTKLVTDRDREMMSFSVETGVDYVGISFVESAEHVRAIQSLGSHGSPRVVAKIENQGGLDHAREIIEAADAIMIDRGDLSVETALETVALMQKDILLMAQRCGKPAIVATEMLHSMISSPSPTKAEVADITNAVLDGCAATMLSGETAVGQHPLEAVRLMRTVSEATEAREQLHMDRGGSSKEATIPEIMSEAIGMICRSLPITKIVAVTVSGYAARMIAARRPRQPILAVSNDARAARSFNLFFGTEGIFLDIPFAKDSTDHVVKCIERLWVGGHLLSDDMILVTTVGYPRHGNRMNLVETHYVRDLQETLEWKK